MKKRFVIFVLFISSVSFAGPGATAGNGGGAWVCRNQDHSLRWAKLVDLVEAQGEFDLTLALYPGSYQEIVSRVEKRISKVHADSTFQMTTAIDQLHDLVANTKGNPQVTYVDEALPLINDSLYIYAPPASRCSEGVLKYEQVVNYKGNGDILIQSELFNSFSQFDQAALVVHEGIYALRRRTFIDENSVETRRFVGLFFSDLSQDDLNNEIDPKPHASDTLFPSGAYDFSLQIMQADGSLAPVPNQSFSVIGYFAPVFPRSPTWDPVPSDSIQVEATTDGNGQASVTLPSRPGMLIDLPQLLMTLAGASSYASIELPGWSAPLNLWDRSETLQYYCEVTTISFVAGTSPGKVDVVCAQSNSR
jgi:hypothetical protein